MGQGTFGAGRANRITSGSNFGVDYSAGNRLNRSDSGKYVNRAGNGYTYRYGRNAGVFRPL